MKTHVVILSPFASLRVNCAKDLAAQAEERPRALACNRRSPRSRRKILRRLPMNRETPQNDNVDRRPAGRRTRCTLVTCACAVALLACVSPASAEFKKVEWPMTAPVTLAVRPAEFKGLVEMSLTDEVLEQCQSGFGDLRLLDAQGAESPYVAQRSAPAAAEPWADATLLNRTFEPNKSTTVVADFGRRIPKDSVIVHTTGDNFRRETLIESSDDGVTFRRVRAGGLLFRVTQGGRTEFERRSIPVPLNDQRYLRITVTHDAGDGESVEIAAVQAPLRTAKDAIAPRTRPVEPLTVEVGRDAKTNATIVEFDLGLSRLPLEKMALDFADANFFRRVSVEGRDTKTTVVRTPREDGKFAEKTVDTPWAALRWGAVFRYSAGDREDCSTTLPLDGVATRYIRLVIQNGDDPPLKFEGAKLTRYLVLVQFPCASAGPWTLYYGNPKAGAPSYDLPHYIKRLETEGIVPASLGAAVANPLYSGPSAAGAPWWEKYPHLVWGALIILGVALAVLIARQLRALKTHGNKSGDSSEGGGTQA